MWMSVCPWAPTGYGQQTAIWAPRIKAAGHDIAISCLHGLQYTTLDWEGVRCYPGDHTGANKRMLKHHITREYSSADDVQVISLWDVWSWVDLDFGGMLADFDGLRMAAWVPVDSTPVPPKTRVALDKYDVRTIAMSKHGEEQLRDAGYDPLYVPHGIDTITYRPADDRADARARVGIPEDRFVVGMVAFNQGVQPPRKGFPQMLEAFSEFRRRHDDAFLYLHTEMFGAFQGLNLMALAEMMGIPSNSLGYAPQMNLLAGEISTPRMADLYSSMDVLVNPSYGEGFGIPIVEAQACGTPVITSHWTSMPELTGAGWTVGGDPWYNPSTGAYWFHASTSELIEALEVAYQHKDDQELRDKARAFAVQYDADVVMEDYWKPALAALDGPREVPPLKVLPNRAARRAKKVAA